MEPEKGLERKAADSRPVEDGGAYYMVGPFGRLEKGLLWSALSIGLATGLGCLWALWSMAGTLSAIEQLVRTRR